MRMDARSLPDHRRRFRRYRDLAGPEGSEVLEQVLGQRERLSARLSRIRRVVLVASGKGGVGKSALAANIAAALAHSGHRVGALDADLNGPSLGGMLGAPTAPLAVTADGVVPAVAAAGVRLVSMGLLASAEDAPIRWRGPETDGSLWRGALETGVVRELIADVAWGDLEFLLVDLPPGSDRIERMLELIPAPDAVVLVTTPSLAACAVVTRSARLLREAGIDRVGLAINMSAYQCPCCGHAEEICAGEGVASLLEASGLTPWARVPFDPAFAVGTDGGSPPVISAPDSAAARTLSALAERIRRECDA
jgi:ATP-binding protein involved in chromosome partitioning